MEIVQTARKKFKIYVNLRLASIRSTSVSFLYKLCWFCEVQYKRTEESFKINYHGATFKVASNIKVF
ncbi:hypothetical protein BpHYR1_014329 [Brachionus plicatilis]|uniref:Uncharacterized protein n=1 Tax=Brachionus plicatilis TaxID=10195 RepID=A0A3M7Q819_BRAPC|nr:hypothetical protein BpHYR1_014329 [Brachionus plicatilis]